MPCLVSLTRKSCDFQSLGWASWATGASACDSLENLQPGAPLHHFTRSARTDYSEAVRFLGRPENARFERRVTGAGKFGIARIFSFSAAIVKRAVWILRQADPSTSSPFSSQVDYIQVVLSARTGLNNIDPRVHSH